MTEKIQKCYIYTRVSTAIQEHEVKELHLEKSTLIETVCCLYHQKEDFISVPYELKNADYLQQLKKD